MGARKERREGERGREGEEAFYNLSLAFHLFSPSCVAQCPPEGALTQQIPKAAPQLLYLRK